MNQFLSLPDWAPAWLGPLLVIFGALFALAFLLMPFTVFSLKAKLDQIEDKLDDLVSALHAAAPPQIVPRGNYAQPYASPEYQPSAYPVKPPLAPRGPEAYRGGEPYRNDQPLSEPKRPDLGPPDLGPPDLRPVEPVRAEPRFSDAPRASTRSEPKLNWPR